MGNPYRHILMIYPEFPRTYWGGQYLLPLAGKKSLMPPLGLLTIAALTPAEYEFRLVDLNCEPLTDRDLEWAEIVCFSAMLPQKTSLFDTAPRCQAAGKLVVFGGPFPTACPEECRRYADVLALNEGEITWPAFLADLARGTYKSLYTSEEKPDVTQTPVPRFALVNLHDYGAVPLQFSRGCPFQCEFCDIIVMFGRRPRTKTPRQMTAELEAVYNTGYRGMIFIVDDNFIGNKREVKKLLPEIAAWNKAHGHPFVYFTEATVNLAEDEELLKQMVRCNFKAIFVGVETPSKESLKETKKYQNMKRSLVESVNVIRHAGLMIMGGFIIGFDSDAEDIFARQIEFIRQTAIPIAVVGLLVALPGTPLYQRMEQAGRLEPLDYDRSMLANGFTNIVSVLPRETLLAGYRRVIETIYSPDQYMARVFEALRGLPRPESLSVRIQDLRLVWRMLRDLAQRRRKQGGILVRAKLLRQAFSQLPVEYKQEAWRLIWAILRKRPDQLPRALAHVFVGIHFYRFSFESVLPELDLRLAQLTAESAQENGRLASAANTATSLPVPVNA
jgi:radical SAM superfamily enzyme YgiQ (UPF0313 family)